MDRLGRITLTGIRGTGFHGVLPQERAGGQEFIVDVELMLDVSAAVASDEVSDTVDYGRVAEDVMRHIEGEPVNLIETLAHRIATDIRNQARAQQVGLQSVTVTVHKPGAPIAVPFQDVAVTVTRGQQ